MTPFFIGQTVAAVAAALDAAAGEAPGVVAVLGHTRVAHALRGRGHQVLFVSDKRKSLRRVKGERLYCRFDALPIAAHSLGALVGFDAGQRSDWSPVLAEWARVVRPGGAVVLVDRTSPSELSRRALCAGLMELEQRQSGRTFVTSGQVSEVAAVLDRQ